MRAADAAPTFESRVGTVVLAAGADAPTRAAWARGRRRLTVGGRACFFATTRKAYADGAELTASYGAGYQRHYDAYAGRHSAGRRASRPTASPPPTPRGSAGPSARAGGTPTRSRSAAVLPPRRRGGEVRLFATAAPSSSAASSPAASAASATTASSSTSRRGPKRPRPEMVDEWENEA